MELSSFNRVKIDLASLRHNYMHLKRVSGDRAFLAMVKADAYGHGMAQCASELEESGCTIFGVAELCEAVALRQSGIKSEIFSMIGFEGRDADLFLENSITPVVYDTQSLEHLSECCVRRKTEIGVHIKVDTGMSRLGVNLEAVDVLLEKVAALPGLRLGGIASHLPSSDDKKSSSTLQCLERFAGFQEKLRSDDTVTCHIANSGGTLYFPESRQDMVRCGISLYGYYPDGRDTGSSGELRQVMSFTTRVLQVKEVDIGSGISYGATFITSRKTRLAVLPVGYEDGFSRHLSNCGEVLIRGRRAPVLGRVCMNLCMVDITDIDGVSAGDEAVVLGTQGDETITADDIAAKVGSISYEVLCMIGNNNQREFT